MRSQNHCTGILCLGNAFVLIKGHPKFNYKSRATRPIDLPDARIAHEGFFATHFFTVSDEDKSKDFYVRILGGELRSLLYNFRATFASDGQEFSGEPEALFNAPIVLKKCVLVPNGPRIKVKADSSKVVTN
jgi:hypothetical protein